MKVFPLSLEANKIFNAPKGMRWKETPRTVWKKARLTYTYESLKL
jgi:hypothetical protein